MGAVPTGGVVAMASKHRRQLAWAQLHPTFITTATVMFALLQMISDAACDATVITAHDIGSSVNAEISKLANGTSAVQPQDQSVHLSIPQIQPTPHVPVNHSDNDLHFTSTNYEAIVGNHSSHVEAREETNNRIADPRATANSLPANKTVVTKASSTPISSGSKNSNPVKFSIPVNVPSASLDPEENSSLGPPRVPYTTIVTARVNFPSAADVARASAAILNETQGSEINESRVAQEATGRSINSGEKILEVNTLKNETKRIRGTSNNGSEGGKNTDEVINSSSFLSNSNSSKKTQNIETPKIKNENDKSEQWIEVTTEVPEQIFTEIPTTDSTFDGDNHIPLDKVHPSFRNGNDSEENVVHECTRECIAGAEPKRCYYHFEVSGYYAMSKACYDCPSKPEDCDLPDCIAADGVYRGITVINRMLPGPAIEVCLRDTIVVDLYNTMVAETTTIHWHGHHQRGTPYMDGVPYVTQCPVAPLTTFRYTFVADTPGTHFWHSHTGHQRADGAFGSMIVRVPRSEDVHADLWDRDEVDHQLLLLDWGSTFGADRFLAHYHSKGLNKPTALLVNGRGHVPSSLPLPVGFGPQLGDSLIPPPEFIVQEGLRYRFRVINAGFLNCPVEISVDDHDLLIISSDGSDVNPVAATSLVTYAGERFDFVLEANGTVGAYWIRIRGLLDCNELFNSVHQAAVLRYEGAPDGLPSGELSYAAAHRPGHQVNSLNVGTGTPGSTVIAELEAMRPDDESLKEEPDYRFYIAYDFYLLDNPHFHKFPHYGVDNVTDDVKRFTPQLNHLSMKMPSMPLMPQRDQLDQSQFCNDTSMAGKGCEDEFCECPHVVQVPLNSILEIVLIDEGVPFEANHPFHLHGYAFRVVAMQRLGEQTSLEEVRRMDEEGLIHRNLKGAPLKDTCTVPDGGFIIIRLNASSPGYWLFHCHLEFHVETGMAMVFKIGEHSDFPPVPKGFPQCGDWVPDDEGISISSSGNNKKDSAESNEIPGAQIDPEDESTKLKKGRFNDGRNAAIANGPIATILMTVITLLPSILAASRYR